MIVNINQKESFKISLKSLVLYITLLMPCFLPVDLFSVILVMLGIVVLFLSHLRVKISSLFFVLPLLTIFILGLAGTGGHEIRNILRDLIYALTPISIILIGYWLAESDKMWPGIIKTVVQLAIFLSIFHLMQFILKPGLMHENIDDIRKEVINPGTGLIILSLVLGTFQNRLKSADFFPRFFPRYIALPLLMLSFVMSFSRTGSTMAILISISILGFLDRLNWRAITGITVLVLTFVLIAISTPPDESGTFRSKLAHSISEVAMSDYSDMDKITNSWRGFETYKALSTFKSGQMHQQIIGQGFGTLVDLGFTMNLAGIDFNKIPVLHNGYAYILVKTGIIGILCYLFFYFTILRNAKNSINSINPDQIILPRILLGCTLSLMFSMLVVGGMAEIHDSEFVLFVGFLLRKIELVPQ